MMLLHLFLFYVYLCLHLVYLYFSIIYCVFTTSLYIRWQHKNVVDVIIVFVLSFNFIGVPLNETRFQSEKSNGTTTKFLMEMSLRSISHYFSIYFICQLIIIFEFFCFFFKTSDCLSLSVSFSVSIFYTYISYNMISEFTTFKKKMKYLLFGMHHHILKFHQ